MSFWLTLVLLSLCSPYPSLTVPRIKSNSSDGVCLLTAHSSLIVCFSTKIIPLCFSCGRDSKVYTWTFQLAPVSVPLLGANFLEHFNLLVNIKGQKVVHAQYPESVVLHAYPAPQPAFRRASFLVAPPQIKKLLYEFLDVLAVMVSQSLNLATESVITFSLLQVLRFKLNLVAWITRSSLPPRRNILKWRKLVSSEDPRLPGPLPFTWL